MNNTSANDNFNTLKDIFKKETCSDWKAFWHTLSNFLDDFKQNPNSDILKHPPYSIDEKTDAFVAATVEQLAIMHNLQIPKWVYHKRYFLKEPFFPSGLKGDYRFFALKESPLAFSARQIFITKNALDRV